MRSRRLTLFALFGLFATVIGAATVAVVTVFTGSPIFANAVGYACGLILSYTLNSRYTFGQSRTTQSAIKFLACFLVAFMANLVTVYFAVYWLHFPKVVGSLAGLPVYTIAFYLLCEKLAFGDQSHD